jgi:hypothetical protein
MKTLGTISLAVFLFLITGSAVTYSQDRDDSRPKQTQEEKDNAKNNEKDKQQDKSAKQEQKREQGQSDAKQEQRHDKDVARQQEKQEKQEQKRQRSGQGMEGDQHEHPAAANQGKHIPDNKFRAHFGRQHTFRVQRAQVVNVAQPVIVYGGYSFQLVEAWPTDWGFEDNCYIDYVDGEYFLFDVLHPSIRIAVFVVG